MRDTEVIEICSPVRDLREDENILLLANIIIIMLKIQTEFKLLIDTAQLSTLVA